MEPDIGQNRDFCLLHLHSTPLLGGGAFPSEYCHAVWYRKPRMVWLPDGEDILKICLFVSTESMNVTDRRTDTHKHRMAAWAALAQHRARLCRSHRGVAFLTTYDRHSTVLHHFCGKTVLQRQTAHALQTLHEQGRGAAGAKGIISSYPGKESVDHTDSFVLRKPGNGRPATTSACTV